MLKSIQTGALLCVSVLSCNTLATQEITSVDIKDILKSEHRSIESKARDDYRHPDRVIEFFDISKDETVLELWPGNGWYSEILGPYLKDEGQLVAATFGLNNQNSKDKRKAFWSRVAIDYREKMSDTELYGNVQFSEFDPPDALELAPENSVDTALIIRTLHIWDEVGELQLGLNAVYRALKLGGVLGIIQHRADQFSDISSSAPEGYLSESYVIKAVENAGFELVDSSDINANEKDTKNYPRGVYTLPPTLAMGALDQDIYMAIGESDRMTLKFIKPKAQ